VPFLFSCSPSGAGKYCQIPVKLWRRSRPGACSPDGLEGEDAVFVPAPGFIVFRRRVPARVGEARLLLLTPSKGCCHGPVRSSFGKGNFAAAVEWSGLF